MPNARLPKSDGGGITQPRFDFSTTRKGGRCGLHPSALNARLAAPSNTQSINTLCHPCIFNFSFIILSHLISHHLLLFFLLSQSLV